MIIQIDQILHQDYQYLFIQNLIIDVWFSMMRGVDSDEVSAEW